MATHGGTYLTLVQYQPSPTVKPITDNDLRNPSHRKTRKRIGTPKRPTHEWTGITDYSLIPATRAQRATFKLTRHERAIKK